MHLGKKYQNTAPRQQIPEICSGCIVAEQNPQRIGQVCMKVVTAKHGGVLTAYTPPAGASECRELIEETIAKLSPAELALHDVVNRSGPPRF